MKGRKGFTLIELMVVILIVGILAAVAIPLMRGRIDSAKWSEANAAAGTIRSALRAYWAEKGPTYTSYAADLQGNVSTFGGPLGITADDLDGRYFGDGCYVISAVSVGGSPPTLSYTITVTAATDPGPGGAPSSPASMAMNQAGNWQ
jgi:prepilin-type N-terminal cleavage/methylation domain-containing protein